MSQNLISGSLNPVRWIRTTKRYPCPICGKGGYCEVSDDGKTAHCMRVPSSVTMRHRQGGWLHQRGPEDTGVTIADLKASLEKTSGKELKPLPPEQVDRINRALLVLCPLAENHRQYLMTTGVDPAGCGSLTYSEASIIAASL